MVGVNTPTILDSKREWTMVGLICQEQKYIPVYLQESSPNMNGPPENSWSVGFCLLSVAQSKEIVTICT
jgi:hypothetical protein